MSIDRRKAALLGAAAVARLALFVGFPGLPDLLTGRVEISTPITSFKRLQEGLFLYSRNVSPYDGGVYHQAPMLLALFSVLPDPSRWPIFTYLLYIAVDLLSAYALMSIADSGEAGSARLFTSPRRDRRWSSLAVAASFLFNPFTIATCIGRSTSVFASCAILHAISQAILGKSTTSMIALAFAAHLLMYPVLLLPPLILLSYDRRPAHQEQQSLRWFSLTKVVTMAGVSLVLFQLGYSMTGSWQFISSTYGMQLLLTDLTPNVGLWWYFFIEMFDSFRPFFLSVFWLHLSSYVGGLTLRFRRQPLFVLTTLLGIFAIFKPYPSVADASLYLGMVPLYGHIFPLMRYSFLAAAVMLYASLLGPAFYYLWIYAGSGNANFFYAITLVWNLGISLLLVADMIYAALRDEWEVERPDMKGKAVRQI